MTITVACLKFFGRKEGQSTAEFAAELRALTDKDRADLKPLLSEALGVPIED